MEPLRGAVNDARGWARLLVDHYDFAARDVTILLDREATRTAILLRLHALAVGARRGDVLVFAVAARGSLVPASAGRYDEAICPWDASDNLLLGDDLREVCANLKPGVRMVVLSDTGHAGPPEAAEEISGDRRARFVSLAELGRVVPAGVDSVEARRPPARAAGAGRDVLLRACSDGEVAYESRFGRSWRGAMSRVATTLIARAGFDITYSELHCQLVPALARTGLPQVPTLVGPPGDRGRTVFT